MLLDLVLVEDVNHSFVNEMCLVIRHYSSTKAKSAYDILL